MSATPWYPPDADEQGFVTIHSLRRRARSMNVDAFVAAFPLPALVPQLSDEDIMEAARREEDEDSGVHLLTAALPRAGFLRYLSRVAFLAKRPGNPFAHLIAVGRSNNNDLVLALDTVSKLHGTFVSDPKAWTYSDRHSTNGSWLGERRLEPGVAASLRDGDILRLGPNATVRFVLPGTLYEHVHAT